MDSITILLVDDDISTQDTLYRVLEDEGYSILVAGNGVDALSICRQCRFPIALLLTDVTMPGMSGFELARRALPLQPSMKALFISADAENGSKLLAGATGVRRFLAKRFGQAALMRSVRSVLAC